MKLMLNAKTQFKEIDGDSESEIKIKELLNKYIRAPITPHNIYRLRKDLIRMLLHDDFMSDYILNDRLNLINNIFGCLTGEDVYEEYKITKEELTDFK